MRSPESRLLRAVRRIVAELTAPLLWHAIVRYRVVSQQGDRATLQAVQRGLWPDAVAIPLTSSLPGGRATYTPGAVVYVAFVEGDPTLPLVIGGPRYDDPAFQPSAVSVGESTSTWITATEHVIRYGDTVNVPGLGMVILGDPTPGLPIAKLKA